MRASDPIQRLAGSGQRTGRITNILPQQEASDLSANDYQFLQKLAAGYERCSATPKDGLLLAVSGGPDSVALLHATIELWPNQLNQIVIAHVHHGLRPEATADAEFVRGLAADNGLRGEILTLPDGSLEANSDGSLEEAARKVRYECLSTTAEKLGLKHVATAHHIDDQAETVLHNIVRGTGLRGLAGMSPARQLSKTAQLIRPLLNTPKTEIVGYLRKNSLQYRVDTTNNEDVFTRNRLRNRILPLLKSEINDAVDLHLVVLAEQAQQTVSTLDALARHALATALLEQQPNCCRIDRSPLRNSPVELVRHALTVLWAEQNWPRKKMTFDHWQQIAALILAEQDGQLDLPGRISVSASGNLVRLILPDHT